MLKHGIPQDQTGMKNFQAHQKYLKKEPVEKKVEKISEEVRAEKEKRRGTEKKIDSKKKITKEDAESVDIYSDV